MKKYEIIFILHNKADIINIKEKIKKILLNNSGKIIEENDWGIMNFAYPIQKEEKGFYFVLICETKPENIMELQRIYKITKSIIRLLVINIEKEKNYIQSTKLSKTEIANDKIEHKTIGKKYKKRTFDIKIDEPKNTITSNTEKTK